MKIPYSQGTPEVLIDDHDQFRPIGRKDETTSPAAAPSRPAMVCAGVVTGVALLVIAGWIFDIGVLKSVVPGAVTMKFNTAMGFVLAALSLFGLGSRRRLVAVIPAVLILVLGLLVLSQYSGFTSLDVDQLFVTDDLNPVATTHPGRMSPVTALLFAFTSAGFLLLSSRWRGARDAGRWMATFVGSMALLDLIAHFYGARAIYDVPPFTGMALNTSWLFLVLAAGGLLVNSREGWTSTFLADTDGGRIARMLVTASLVLPPLFGWIRLKGEQAGFYGTEFGVSVFATLTVVSLSSVAFGVSHRLHREEVRRRMFQRERDQFFNLSLEMLCIADSAGYFRQINPSWERVLGWSRETLLNRPFIELVHPDDVESTKREAARLQDETGETRFENRYHTRSGEYRTLQWATARDPSTGLLFAAARDVTEVREQEQEIHRLNRGLEGKVHKRTAELERSNRELEAFTYSVSHDLRAPLRSIDGFSRVLVENYRDVLDDQARNYLDRVRAASRRMGSLIDDLLRLSRVSKLKVSKANLDLRPLVSSVMEELKSNDPDRQAELSFEGDLHFHADPSLMGIVLDNLIGNAWKFTSRLEVARIEVGEQEDESGRGFFVRDNGAGFDEHYADKLFKAFQRLHRQDEFEGTGIGLATVQRIVHLHGGTIWAEGEVDRGAAFFITFPSSEDGEE